MEHPEESGDSRVISHEKTIFLTSLGLLVVGSVGYFSLFRDLWLFYVFAHLGALGVMGLLGSAAGFVARKKRRSYWMAFSLGSVLPIILGVVAVLIFVSGEGGQLYCGGLVSLGIAILMIVLYLFAKKKTPRPA